VHVTRGNNLGRGVATDQLVRAGLVARVFSGRIEPHEVGDIIVQQALAGLDAQHCEFVTVSPDGSLEMAAAHGLARGVVEQLRVLGGDAPVPVADAIRFRESVWIRSKEDRDARYPHLASLRDSEASVSLPLVVGDEVLGALFVGFETPREFDQHERFFIRTLAHLSALALARLHPPGRRTEDALASPEASDAAAVADVQRLTGTVELLERAFVPEALPRVDGFDLAGRYRAAQSGTPLGGDWYDAFVTRDGRLVVGIGDVAGHGVRTTAAMVQLRHAMRAYAFAGHGPGETLALLDELVTSLAPDAFATAALFSIGPSGNVRYARAGHPYPLLRVGGAVVPLRDGARPPLGAGPARTTEGSFAFDAGTALVLYTDGLVERRDAGLEVGLARLADTVRAFAADATADECAGLLLDACPGGRDPQDDVCLLVVRRLAAPAG
jgi:serine phosphatase RsbU (regulator of sigma subunit)